MSNEAPPPSSWPPEGEPERQERARRTNLLLSATIEAEGIAAPVRIRNLSETGVLLDGPKLPIVGARLILRRLQLQVSGRVVWVKNGQCGVQFEETISVAQWSSVNWIAPVETNQQRVDSIQAAARAGALAGDANEIRPEPVAARLTAPASDVETLIAEELISLRQLLEDMGEELLEEPVVVQRHPGTLQSFDLACQILGHLASILAAENRVLAVDAIGMVELRERLRAGRR